MSTESYDAELAFQTAESFAYSVDVLKQEVFQGATSSGRVRYSRVRSKAYHFAPKATLMAFTIEVYMKYLQIAANLPVRGGHDLAKVFESLSDTDQKAIEYAYMVGLAGDQIFADAKSKGQPVPQSIREHLADLGPAPFEQWRYIYESKNAIEPGKMFYFDPILAAVQQRARAVHAYHLLRKRH